jgi:hypothetical protein
MPFISQLTAYKSDIVGNPFNGTVTVEQMLFVSCNQFVTLNAIIDGDLTGHDTEWVQVSGYPVIWLEDLSSPNITYQQPTVRDDKSFRFYIDKGTLNQVVREILVSAVPQDNVFMNSDYSPPAWEHKWSDSTEVATNLLMEPGFSAYGTITVDNPERAIVWSKASDPNDTSVAFVMTRQADGSFTQTAVGAAAMYPAAVRNVSYRIDTQVTYHGITRRSQSAPVSSVPNPNLRDVDGAERFNLPGNYNGDSRLTITAKLVRSLEATQPADETVGGIDIAMAASTLGITGYLVRQLESAQPPTDDSVSGIDIAMGGANLHITQVQSIGITTLG